MNNLSALYTAITNCTPYIYLIISLVIIFICIPCFKYKENLVKFIAVSFILQAVLNIYNYFLYGRIMLHFKDDYVTQARIRIPSERCYWIILIITELLFILYPTIRYKSKGIIVYFPIRILMIGFYIFFTNFLQKTAYGRSLTIGEDGSYNYDFSSNYQLECVRRGGYILLSILLIAVLLYMFYKNRDKEPVIPKLWKYELAAIVVNALKLITYICFFFIASKSPERFGYCEIIIMLLDILYYLLTPVAAFYILKQLKTSVND